MKLDILVIAAHPDDAELSCGGTIISHTKKGYKVGIIDLTQGEMGTRGSAETRLQEANDAGRILNLSIRENMMFRDCFFQNDEGHQLKLIAKIRKYRPEIIITNPLKDRHPDHAKAGELVTDSNFLSGLTRIETLGDDGQPQKEWRAKQLYYFIQFVHHTPDFVVDISAHLEQKFEAIKAYKSQFHDPLSEEPQTILSTSTFMEQIKARTLDMGFKSYIEAAEGFLVQRTPAIDDLFSMY